MATETAVVVDEAQQTLQTGALALVDQARNLVIIDQQDLDEAGAFLRSCKTARANIENFFAPGIKRWYDGHKAAVAQKNGIEAPVIEAETIAKRTISDFQVAQEKERRQQEQAAREAARKAAETEALEQASRLERAGEHEEAAAVVARAEVAPPPVVVVPAMKTAGVSTTKRWKHRYVLKGDGNPDTSKINLSFLAPDDKKIAEVVRSMGPEATALVGGIEVYQDVSVSARRTG